MAVFGIENEFDAVLVFERHPSAVAAGAVAFGPIEFELARLSRRFAFGPVEFELARLSRRCWRCCRRRFRCEGTTSFVVNGGGDGGGGGSAGHAE